MQDQALAALAALLVAVALAACGGGEETSSSAQGAEQGDRPAVVEEVRQRAREIEEERRQEEESAEKQDQGEGSDAGGKSQPAAPALPAHQDSGGGAAQFRQKGGDNSIQETGTEAPAADRAEAAAVLHAYLDSRVAGRWDDACSYLAAEAVAGIEKFAATYGGDKPLDGCPDVLEALTTEMGKRGLREAAQADVGSLRIRGTDGFLLYHGARGLDYAFLVTREAGTWKLTAPEGSPLP